MTAGPLCRAGGLTCAACCFGRDVTAAALASAVRRHARLFARRARRAVPSRGDLLAHEVAARRGLDLVWGVLLVVPGVGDVLRGWLGRRLVCAFLGCEGPAGTRVGCLLHPSRWGGRDRRGAAFALLRGIACGAPEYLCLTGHWFARAPLRSRAAFLRRCAGLGWVSFSRAVRDFRPARARPRAAARG